MTHLLAVDRCYPHDQRPAAMLYARQRLILIEGRLPHRVEVEAVVVTCPHDHDALLAVLVEELWRIA